MKWLTVKDLATYLKLSEIMIYRLAQNSEIPASKVGGSWRFSEEAIDKWLLDRQTTPPFPKDVKRLIEKIVDTIKRKYRATLSSIYIFGSFARGDADKDSDLDLLVVFKNINEYWHLQKELNELIYNDTFAKGISLVVTTTIIPESEFLTGQSPLLINVRREGIKAA